VPTTCANAPMRSATRSRTRSVGTTPPD
jgi:hypothetical protein